MRFAKAMVAHHEGALEMARDYHANRDARNGYLGLMNVDIITDQTQEIALMRRVIAAYPGDPDAVRVDPSMVHGMEGMKHGGHAGYGASAAPAAESRSAPARSREALRSRPGTHPAAEAAGQEHDHRH